MAQRALSAIRQKADHTFSRCVSMNTPITKQGSKMPTGPLVRAAPLIHKMAPQGRACLPRSHQAYIR